MIQPGQQLIRYIGGMSPRLVDVVFVEDGQAVTSDHQTVDAKTLKPADDLSSDIYDIATPSTLAMAQQFKMGLDFCAAFCSMRFISLNGRQPPEMEFS
jgi:hypothetical protein